MKILIGNINVNNEYILGELVSNSGFGGCLKHSELTESTLDIGTEDFRASCGIEQHEINTMAFELMKNGFSIKVI